MSPVNDRLAEVGFSLIHLTCLHRATDRAACVPGSCQPVRPCVAELCGLQDVVDGCRIGRHRQRLMRPLARAIAYDAMQDLIELLRHIRGQREGV